MFKFKDISYKNLNPKRKIKNPKPNPPTPLSPPSPASFVSPEIFEIHGSDNLDTLHEADEFAHISSIPSRRPPPSPRVQLEYSPEPLSDWFPRNLLESDTFSFFGKSSEGTNTGIWGLSNFMAGSKAAHPGKDGGKGARDGFIFLSEEGTPEYQSEGIQPSFVNLSSSEESSLPQNDSRKPAPIQIPGSPLHAKVQGPHYPVQSYPPSSSVSAGLPPSRPDSPGSVDDGMSSAVSGTTLARALFANSFILSSDKRTSRHRSGMVRQDSATLPRGEFPFWRDKRISGGEIILSASSGRGSPVPPVPPVPSNAELLYAAQQSARRSGASSASSPEPEQFSAKSESTPYSGILKTHEIAHRRISPISEAPSSTTSLPIAPDPSFNTSVNQSLSSIKPSSLVDAKSESDKLSVRSAPLRAQRSELLPGPPSGLPSAGSGSGLINDILDEYHSRSDSLSEKGRPLHSASMSSIRSSSSSTSASSHDVGRHQSKRCRYSGRAVLGLSSSPTDARGKPEPRLLSINSSETKGRLPIGQQRPRGERPRSLQVPQSPESPTHSLELFPQTALGSASVPYAERSTNITIPSLHSFTLESLDSPRPVPRGVFTRQRSGSTPNPIMVSRESQDIGAFNITVSPESAASLGGRGRGNLLQTFPETPSAFSPMFTPATAAGPSLWADPNFHFDPSNPPEMRMRSAVLGGSFDQPSLAQQVLLSRAVTSASGNRSPPSRSAPRHPYARKISLLLSPPEEEDTEAKRGSDHSADSSGHSRGHSPEHHIEPSSASAGGHSAGGRTTSPSTSVSSSSNSARPKPLPPPPPLVTSVDSPVGGADVQTKTDGPAPTAPSEHTNGASVTPPSIAEPSQTATPAMTPPATTPPSPQPLRTPPPPLPPLPSQSAPHPASPLLHHHFITPPRLRLLPRQPQTPSTPPPPPPTQAPPSFSPNLRVNSLRTSYDSDLGAPPPYSTVVTDHRNANHVPSRLTESPPPMALASQTVTYSSPTPSERTVTAADSPGQRRARVRPPLPAGPRKPTSQAAVPLRVGFRERNGSVSSISSSVFQTSGGSLPSGGSTSSNSRVYSNASPKFITPPSQWRGFTMEAAKWTFTSEELQAIVSRAIKQSAEASSIRLLRLETLDDELPDEMHRLEMLRLDVKTKYKALVRKRWALLGSLSSHIGSTQEEDSKDVMANMRSAVDELAALSTTLDRLAEELHSTDQQIAQIKSLRDVHSASALAMALRKLNASFLKQVAESQALRVQIDALEAERDEAWKQADEVARDYDDLTERVADASGPITPVSVKSPSCRSSHVLAVRKSSIRVSKAGLRQSRGQSSSVTGNFRRMSASTATPSAVRSTFSSEDVPPVPRIPHPQSLGIVTSDLPSRSSLVSTGTPSSETRAMVRAQEELYEMLGIPVNTRSRRPQSMRSPPADADALPSPSSNPRLSDAAGRGHRPSSLPRSSDLSRYYDVMTADRKAMLATLGMMSD